MKYNSFPNLDTKLMPNQSSSSTPHERIERWTKLKARQRLCFVKWLALAANMVMAGLLLFAQPAATALASDPTFDEPFGNLFYFQNTSGSAGLSFTPPVTATFNLNIEILAAANDNLADAIEASALPFSDSGDTQDATLETNEDICGNQDGGTPGQDFTGSVWYEITPAEAGQLEVDIIVEPGSNISIGLYTGTGHPLTLVSCVDDSPNDGGETLQFDASAGVTYYIRIASKAGVGAFDLAIATPTSAVTLYLPIIIKSDVTAGSWSAQTSGTANRLDGISCPSSAACFAVSTSQVVKTSNGTNWTVQAIDTSGLLVRGISCPSGSICYGAGSSGITINTTNGGASWSKFDLPTGSDLYDIYCPNTSICYTLGDHGRLIIYIPPGNVTTRVLGHFLRGINCPTTETCYAVGVGGAIYKTTNAWANSTLLTSGTAQDLFGISCPTATTCFAVGANGVILTTSDGSTWSSLVSGTTNTLNDISCPEITICYAAGNGGQIVATSNGSTWNAESSGTGQTLHDINCPTTAICYAVGANGTIVARK